MLWVRWSSGASKCNKKRWPKQPRRLKASPLSARPASPRFVHNRWRWELPSLQLFPLLTLSRGRCLLLCSRPLLADSLEWFSTRRMRLVPFSLLGSLKMTHSLIALPSVTTCVHLRGQPLRATLGTLQTLIYSRQLKKWAAMRTQTVTFWRKC